MPVSTLLQLASLMATHPREFYDRVATKIEVSAERMRMREFRRESYNPCNWDEAVLRLHGHVEIGVQRFLAEPQLTEIEARVRRGIAYDLTDAPFALAHCSDMTLARLCYALVRAMQPKVLLETGVAFGVTSAFILMALDVNGQGMLHSVDLPPLGRNASKFVGILVPEALRGRWQLHPGSTRRVLPKLLPRVAPIDIFVHDSLHTYRTMSHDFRIVTPFLSRHAVIMVDDVDGNPAFLQWMKHIKPAFSTAVREGEKQSWFGVGLKT